MCWHVAAVALLVQTKPQLDASGDDQRGTVAGAAGVHSQQPCAQLARSAAAVWSVCPVRCVSPKPKIAQSYAAMSGITLVRALTGLVRVAELAIAWPMARRLFPAEYAIAALGTVRECTLCHTRYNL